MDNKPELKVSVFSDYICPFCYIGFLRLEKLRREFDLKVNWALIEIHPDTPAAGQDLKERGYSSEQWHQMMDGLAVMAGEEGIVLAEQTRISNSRSALMLAEAAKEAGKEIFYSLHRGIFEAYFVQGRDIGEQAVLEVLAQDAGLNQEVFEIAFADPVYAERLNRNMMLARDAGVTGTPTYFFGQRKITGAVETELLLATARQLTRE
jgi:predicted DsbA family dithiol-disulfide isomerase